MNKKDLVNAVVEATENNFTKKDVAVIVDAVFDSIGNALVNGERVGLVGFGSFEVVDRAAREGRNPQTGEVITVAERKSPKFKAAKALKDAVNS